MVANVVMYADNVLKGFATSFSVVLSCVISSYLLESSSHINATFVLGGATVVGSALVYSLYPATSVASAIPTKEVFNKINTNPSDSNLHDKV